MREEGRGKREEGRGLLGFFVRRKRLLAVGLRLPAIGASILPLTVDRVTVNRGPWTVRECFACHKM